MHTAYTHTARQCARCEELEEQIRQLKEMLTPPVMFPDSWNLTKREMQLLQAFLVQRQVSREYLLTMMYGHDNDIDIRTVDVFVGKLRRKLAAAKIDVRIVPIYGIGYRISDTDQKYIRTFITGG